MRLRTLGILGGTLTGGCPESTQDVSINLKNRQRCIDTADYGPANPRLPNDAYWQRMGKRWRISAKEAKTMRCGNCAAFEVTKKIKD